MALGADRAAVLRMILRDLTAISAIGLGVGTVLAILLGRYVESQLHGVDSRDLATLGGAVGVLAAVVLASGWWPARRASRVNPTVALRQE
jgi:ABC-type antimicrobial peptide transport system permease subunit